MMNYVTVYPSCPNHLVKFNCFVPSQQVFVIAFRSMMDIWNEITIVLFVTYREISQSTIVSRPSRTRIWLLGPSSESVQYQCQDCWFRECMLGGKYFITLRNVEIGIWFSLCLYIFVHKPNYCTFIMFKSEYAQHCDQGQTKQAICLFFNATDN